MADPANNPFALSDSVVAAGLANGGAGTLRNARGIVSFARNAAGDWRITIAQPTPVDSVIVLVTQADVTADRLFQWFRGFNDPAVYNIRCKNAAGVAQDADFSFAIVRVF